jgi:hypothetical protein
MRRHLAIAHRHQPISKRPRIVRVMRDVDHRQAERAMPPASPNCNAHAERSVRSIKEECLDRIVPLGELHLRRLVREYVAHYHAERNHQGIGSALIGRPPPQPAVGPIRRRQRAGGILSYSYRGA